MDTRDIQNEWVNTPPTEEGKYLFYGDPFFGSMGVDYTDRACAEFRLYFVEVSKISNGIVATTVGTFISLRPFDGKKEGHIGLWKEFNTDLPSKEDMAKITDTRFNMK